jgi:hypothetical protein
MKTALLLLFTATFFSSCYTYQFLTLSNTNATNNGKHFTAADSVLQVSYLFDSLNGRIGLVINNKSQQSVTIDWKKSSVITNGDANTMYDNTMPFYATNTVQPFSQPRATATIGEAALPEGTDFIPPNATIKRFTKTILYNITKTTFADTEKLVKQGNDYAVEKFKGKKFTETESPYKLRVYLTYTLNNSTEKVLETSFYASEIIESGFDPEILTNNFYKNRPVIYK